MSGWERTTTSSGGIFRKMAEPLRGARGICALGVSWVALEGGVVTEGLSEGFPRDQRGCCGSPASPEAEGASACSPSSPPTPSLFSSRPLTLGKKCARS